MREAALYSIVLVTSMLAVKIYELIRDVYKFGFPKEFLKVIIFSVCNDVAFILNIAIIPATLFVLLYVLHNKIARVFFVVFSLILLVVHVSLVEYFLQTLVPLGADIFGYSLTDIKQTVGSAGISTTFIVSVIIIAGAAIMMFIIIPKKLRLSQTLSVAFLGALVVATVFSVSSIAYNWKPGQEFSNTISLNKSYFFYTKCYKAYTSIKKYRFPLTKILPSIHFTI